MTEGQTNDTIRGLADRLLHLIDDHRQFRITPLESRHRAEQWIAEVIEHTLMLAAALPPRKDGPS